MLPGFDFACSTLGLEFACWGFMQRALVAAAIVGVAAPSIGVYLVARRLSLMGDGIGHVAFVGVALGLLTGLSPVVLAIATAALGAVAIDVLRERGRTAGDVALAIVFYGGLAAGALLIFLTGQGNNSLSYLFGSILLVDDLDLQIVLVGGGLVVAITAALRKELFAVCYDEEVARVSGLPVRKLNLLMALVAAVTIGVAMRVVGILLVSAMLVLPVAAVQQLTSSFKATVMSSMVLGAALGVGGLLAAFYLDVAPGPTIVLAAIAAFIVTNLWSQLPVLGGRHG